tara:strand:- start:414 stop:875 length:462 start_codon:yes stop_codon:yes gene_type:complete
MADTSLSEKKIGLLVWKLSNFWQSRLRKILKEHNLTLNEYLILESINNIKNEYNELSQIQISSFAGIDITVASVTFKILEKKNLLTRKTKVDQRKKIIEILPKGVNLYYLINPLIIEEENKIFNKLQNETNTFANLLKFLLGKSLRIKATKII